MKLITAILFLIPSLAFAFKPLILHSGNGQVNLLELKVSDECEACEAEEKWVSDLRVKKTLWKKFVPVVEKSEEAGTYPAFNLNGSPWARTEGTEVPEELGDEVGDLNVDRQRLQEFDVIFSPKEKIDGASVTAYFLDQDFISVGTVTKNLRKSGKTFSTRVLIPIPKGQMTQIKSVAFWVTSDDGKILQALGSNIQVE